MANTRQSRCARWLLAGYVALSAATASAEEGGYRLDGGGRNMDDPRYEQIRQWEQLEQRGLALFRKEQHADAYEILAEPARRGFKSAQHALALMHLQEQGVDRNPLIGTALFGLAAESGDRRLQREYKQLLKSLPKKFHDLVEQQRVYYIERYGMAAQGIVCNKVRDQGSNLRVIRCRKEQGEYPEFAWQP